MNKIKVTTASSFVGFDITEYKDFVCHQKVLGSNFFQELGANIADATGRDGNSLIDKLQDSTNELMEEFNEKVTNLDANGVINFNLSYTNLSGSLLGVLMTGTAVNMHPQKDDMNRDVTVLSVTNYVPKRTLRPYEASLHTKQNTTYVSVKFHNYEMRKIEAIKVDISFKDCYNEELLFEDIDFVINQDINILVQSGMVEIPMPITKVGLQRDVKVTLRKYVSQNEVITCLDRPMNSLLSSEELTIFKKNKGADAVDKYKKAETNWRCICGNINLPGDTQCYLCGRDEEDFQTMYSFDYEEMLARMSTVSSATDIKDILMEYIPQIDPAIRMELLEMLASAIEMEKTKGSMKDNIISKLKKKFELS